MKTILLILGILFSFSSCDKVDETMPQYTLSYHANGATEGDVPKPIKANKGSRFRLSDATALRKSGYMFSGWNTQANGEGMHYAAASDFTIHMDTTLYAKWDTITKSQSMKITIGHRVFTATLDASLTVEEFKKLLPLRLNMSDFNKNEKLASLDRNLPTASIHPGRIHVGDIMLYGAGLFVLFYENFSTSYSYTPIGKINDPAGLKEALGSGNINIMFELK